MAGLMLSQETRGQLAAIAYIRWRLAMNSVRNLQGRLELISKIFMAFGAVMGGFGLGVCVTAASWYIVSRANVELLAIILWITFLFWQLVPVMATAFSQNADTSSLLRFPVSYRSFFLIQMMYGLVDLPTAMCSIWLVGATIGVGIAAPRLMLWAAIVFLAFALMNVLLGRMIFAWVERWLAKRRTREIIGVLFFLLLISFQMINPMIARFAGHSKPGMFRSVENLLPLERLTPPGLAASALALAASGDSLKAAGAFALLFAYVAVIFWLLSLRVHKQYLGENLSEAAARVAGPKSKLAVREGWDVPHVSGPVAAIFEKELRYLGRSGPMLFTLVMPVVILFIFRFALTGAGKRENFMVHAPEFAFPVGAAYALLITVNLVYNTFGPEGVGVQFYFASPVRFREILMAKNLVQGTVIALEIFAVWIAASLFFGAPPLAVVCATLAGVLYGVPVNLALGNFLSLYSPKKIDFATLGRQRAAGLTALASVGATAAVLGVSALTVLVARLLGSLWFATAALLVFAAIAWGAYVLVLQRVDGIALNRRENLISELSRA
jgi:ABC-2 type transport system permease protein